MKLKSKFPTKGLYLASPASEQPPLTTREGVNVRTRCPITGRLRGTRRSGMERFISPAVAVGKIQDGISLNIDNKNQTYTAYTETTAVETWSAQLPSSGPAYIVVCDKQGNSYWSDSPNGVVKLNPDKKQLWRISPDVVDPLHEIRAVAVDDSGWVFCGVSTGGKQSSARLYGYTQQPDNKCTVAWTITTGLYVEQLKIYNGELYALLTDFELHRCFMQVYSGPTTGSPTLARSWRVPYPANSFAVMPKSAGIVTCHEPLADRNLDPASLIARSWWTDWDPTKLANFEKRIWAWLDASDIDGDGTFNAAYSDGEEIDVWYDKSEYSRNLYRNLQATDTVPTGDYGPKLARNALAGKDVLAFNGIDTSLCSDPNVSVGAPGSAHLDRSAQRTLLPMYDGAQFVLIMVVKCNPEDAIQIILGQEVSSSHSNSTFRGLVTNQRPGSSDVTATAMSTRPGSLMWYENNPGSGKGPNAHGPDLFPLSGGTGGDGLCVISVVNGGGYSTSCLRINGRTIDAWTGFNKFKGTDPTFLAWSRGVTAATIRKRFAGLIAEVFVLADWYVQGSSPLSNPTRQTLIELPSNVNAAAIPVWDTNLGNVTELERLEGWAAHKWGVAHKLPAGTYNALYFGITDNKPANNDTVTINARVYTWKNVLTGAADEIQIDAAAAGAGGIWKSAWNLMKALNGTGTPGTDYGTGTTPNDSVIVMGIADYNDNSATAVPYDTVAMLVSSRTTASTNIAVAEGSLTTAWERASTYASTSVALGATFYNVTQYPHRYYLTKIASSGVAAAGTATGCIGGPPRSDGTVSTSPYQNLSSPYGMVCKWDPVSAKLRWICTANDNGDATGRGALGYGVACSSEDLIYSLGPRHTAVSTDNVDIRCLVDKKDTYSTATGDGAWTVALGGATEWTKPRLDVDKNDNVYLPYHCSDLEPGAYVYTKAGLQLHAITLSTVNLGYAIAHVPGYPDYRDDLKGTTQSTTPRAEHVMVAGRVECTAKITWSVNPVVGSLENLNFIAYPQGSIGYVGEVVNFEAFLGTDGNVIPAATLADTVLRVQALLNGGSGAGVTYDAYTGGKSQFVRGVLATATSLTFRALYPISVPVNLGTYYAVISESTGGTPTWSGRTHLGVHDYLTTSSSNAFKVALVHSVLTSGSPRRLVNLVVCNNQIYWDNAGTWTAVTGGAFAQSSQYVQSTVLFQKVYFCNGDEILVVDCQPTTPTCTPLVSTSSGPKPPRVKLIETWRGRLVGARTPDDAHNWYMSAVGDPGDWDTDPPVTTPTQAVTGNDTLAGRVPDLINCIAVWNDDLLYFGCDSSIWRLTGDPMAGGQLDLVTSSVGMAFGRPFCFDDAGVLYFFGSRGGIYRMTSKGLPENMTSNRLDGEVTDIDLSSYYPRLVWNDPERTLLALLLPFGSGGTQMQHFAWEKDPDAWWSDTFGSAADTSIQPTALWISDGDGPMDRTVFLGGEDGHVRFLSADAVSDDGKAIEASVVMGPFSGGEGLESRLSMFQAVLAKDQQGAKLSFYATATPDVMGNVVSTVSIPAGMSDWVHLRAKAPYFWVQLHSASALGRWSFESLMLEVSPAGRTRTRG